MNLYSWFLACVRFVDSNGSLAKQASTSSSAEVFYIFPFSQKLHVKLVSHYSNQIVMVFSLVQSNRSKILSIEAKKEQKTSSLVVFA